MTNKQVAIKIIKQLHKNGHQGLFAGGCVRDMLLERRPKDYDIATSARPAEVCKLFRRTVKIGAKFGVIMVIMEGHTIEVATFRGESSYSDGRRPDNVHFCDPKEDAARRDFTINGMYYDPIEKTVIDYVDGQKDLQKKILRTIGSPSKRFGEDYLRMLRAIRFSTALDFTVDEKTYSAIHHRAADITKISGERIAMELETTLTHPNRQTAAKMLMKSKLAEAIFPGINKKDTDFALNLLSHLPKRIDFPFALAGFFSGCDTDFATDACKVLKLSNAHKKHLRFLLGKRDKMLNTNMSLAKLKLLAGKPYFEDLYEYQRAIEKTMGRPLTALLNTKKRADAISAKKLNPKPLLDGHQLIALGVTAGPMVGLVEKEMYIAQLDEKLHNKTDAKNWVKKWLKKHESLED
jgi:poly(A) polymerase